MPLQDGIVEDQHDPGGRSVNDARAEPVEIALGAGLTLRIAGRMDRINEFGAATFEDVVRGSGLRLRTPLPGVPRSVWPPYGSGAITDSSNKRRSDGGADGSKTERRSAMFRAAE